MTQNVNATSDYTESLNNHAGPRSEKPYQGYEIHSIATYMLSSMLIEKYWFYSITSEVQRRFSYCKKPPFMVGTAWY